MARERHVPLETELAHDGLERAPLPALAEDQEPRFSRPAHPGEGPDQGGEVLLDLELSRSQQHGSAAVREPRMSDGLTRLREEIRGHHGVVDGRDALARKAREAHDVVGDALRHGDDGVRPRVDAAGHPAQEPPDRTLRSRPHLRVPDGIVAGP